MEQNNEKTQECSLKIDTIWSEADENLLVKEEIISDMEADCVPSSQETNHSSTEQESLIQAIVTQPTANPAVVTQATVSQAVVTPTTLNQPVVTQGTINQAIVSQVEDGGSVNGYAVNSSLPVWQPLKRKAKSRPSRNEEAEIIIPNKLTCLHDTKNFKIVKRRLRCGDCKSLVCPECCKVMIPNLQSHFLGSGLSNCGTFSCKLCGIIFHSLCALQAHIRIHTMDTPYVCPDCGLIYNNIYFLILHLLNKCYHVYKIVRYKCKHCTGAYFTPETFVRHILETHIHCVFRCLYCSSLFNNYEEFNYHMENLHQKQKIQYLNYFRCSLCSNMVIPRFMYQRHIAQHRENSEFYEVDYQCLCGEIFNLIGAFRAHFTFCNKKGALPPRWSFLQRKLRTQDVLHHELFHSKEVIVRTSPIRASNDTNSSNLNSVKSAEKNTFHNGEGKTARGEVSRRQNFSDMEMNRRMRKRHNEKFRDDFGVSCNNYTNLISSTPLHEKRTQESGKDDSASHQQGNGSEPTNADLEQNSNDSLAELQPGDGSHCEVIHSDRNNMESDQPEGEMQKMYDHIPCDHLGYVSKTRECLEQPKKTTQDEVVPERSCSPKKYKMVTELDEKTGIISTRTVPVEDALPDVKETIVNEVECPTTESPPVTTPPKTFCSDKMTFKVGTSLSCPFCIVLFPKHNLTFQQFRLHLESYHPDAAINVTVKKEEEPQEKTPQEGEEVGSQADVRTNAGEPTNFDSLGYQSPNERVACSEKDQNDMEDNPDLEIPDVQPNEEETDTKSVRDGRSCDDKEDNLEEESGELAEGFNEEVCGSRKGSVEDGTELDESWEVEECKMDIVNSNIEGSSSPKESEDNKIEKKESSGIENNKDEARKEEKEVGNSYESPEEGGGMEEIEEEQRMEESSDLPQRPDSGDKKTFSEYEYEGETSKDSNWSLISGKESRTSFAEDAKPEEKERCRRESEVWSEFYESLMLAERFKKKKKKKEAQEEEEEEEDAKKKSVVSDYSAKRVVKKPKRYRQSSESADSNDYSDSDEDFLLTGDFMSKIYSEENGDAEDQLNKKQLLLNKLENVDGRFVDYLFDVVTRKEKLFELYKKHSTLRANRYTHDLRSYRKKVLNGIKQRGRPLKILRYHELLKKKELGGERKREEVSQLKKRRELSPESKANEKKRGRPRKQNDPGKLKERRKSDKEVDFIEKNFEREENDFSPSKRKRKLSSKLQYYKKISDEKEDFSSGQVITNKLSDPSRKYTCAVCKEVFPVHSELREHIVVHRMEENTYQCLECGECFVVRPSLEKHLHAFHKIKNTDKYITENECCNIKKELLVEGENEPLKENQCKVCKDQFERPIDLTKHFRIHGMAFLKEFKKEGKSSEKRNV